jgi:general secretion pathway protein J
MVEPSQAEGGFTLIELLVTLALLGLLTMVMFGSMRFGVQVWARTGTGLTETNALRKAEDLLKADLSRAYPLYSSSGTKASIAFDGDEHRIAYLTPSRDKPGMMERVVLETTSDGKTVDLMRTDTPELARAGDSRQKQLMSHLRGVTFAYYGAEQDDKKPTWSNTWQNRTRLPTLIQVAIEAKDGSETFLVAPRLASDAGCVFDALTKRCRGR